jgi:transcriptional regulator with XRE-family HTH domain
MSSNAQIKHHKNDLEALLELNPGLARRVADRAGLAELASLLIQLRHELGLTQKQLAERANLPKTTISELENTANDGVTLRTLVRIARGAGARLDLNFDIDPANAGKVCTSLHTDNYNFRAEVKAQQVKHKIALAA